MTPLSNFNLTIRGPGLPEVSLLVAPVFILDLTEAVQAAPAPEARGLQT